MLLAPSMMDGLDEMNPRQIVANTIMRPALIENASRSNNIHELTMIRISVTRRIHHVIFLRVTYTRLPRVYSIHHQQQ